jgi:gluconolactonase
MRRLLATVFALAFVCEAQSGPPQKPARGIAGVIAAGTVPHVVVSGLASADDPIQWLEGSILFSDPRTGRILRVDDEGGLSVFLEGLHHPLGIAIDTRRRVLSVQSQEGHTGVRVVWPPDAASTVAGGYEGVPFNRPNDLVVDSRGGVYLTDPGLNAVQEEQLRAARDGTPLGPRLPPAVYYIPPGGQAKKVAEEISRPNGIQLSPDERTLYVNDTNGPAIVAFEVQPDGSLKNRRTFARYVGRSSTEPAASGADGLAIDAAGRVYGVTHAGVEVLSSEGKHLGVIPVACTSDGRRCQGVAFAGPEKRTLYVAGQGTVLRVAMLAQGWLGRVK